MRWKTMALVVVLSGCGGGDAEPSAPACPELAPMVDGSSWTYVALPTADWTGQVTETVVRTIDDQIDRLEIATESVMETSQGSIDYHTEVESAYRCDAAGLHLSYWRQQTDPTGPGTGSTFYEVSYSPPWLLVPTGLADGSSWTSDMELMVAHTTQPHTPENVSWKQSASAETVDTPAGSFEAITVTTTTDNGTSTRSWAAGIGLVRTDQMELDSYVAP